MLKPGSWLRQPTTMLGLAMIVCALMMALLGLVPAATFLCVLVPALGLMGLNDNTAFTDDIKTLAVDAVTSVTENHLQANLPRIIQEGMKAAAALTARAAVIGLLVLTSLCLAACGTAPSVSGTTAPTTAAQILAKDAALACSVDGKLQPIAAATLEALVPGAATTLAVTLDALLVHPAVMNYCKSKGGTPAAVASVATPAATPVFVPVPAATAPAATAPPPAPTSLLLRPGGRLLRGARALAVPV